LSMGGVRQKGKSLHLAVTYAVTFGAVLICCIQMDL